MDNLIDHYRNEHIFEVLKKHLEESDLDITVHNNFVRDIYLSHKVATSLHECFYEDVFIDPHTVYEYMMELIKCNRSIRNTLSLLH